MFRALLWKEWRELWKWPIFSVAYVLLVSLLWWPTSRALSGDIWSDVFLPWMIGLGVIIPTFLFGKEMEAATSPFLLSKPLDRFRLWWWRLLIGLTVCLVSVILMYVAVYALAQFYERNASFESQRAELLWGHACFFVFVYGLASLTSILFKRRVVAVAVCALFFVLLCALWVVASWQLEPIREIRKILVDSSQLSAIRFAVLAPILLFASLAVFARGSVWRQTRKNIAFGYAVSAMILLVPSAAGTIYISNGIKDAQEQHEGRKNGWFIHGVFNDGDRVLATLYEGDRLVSVDIPGRKAHLIHKGLFNTGKVSPEGNTVTYVKRAKAYIIPSESFIPRPKLILSDFAGEEKTALFKSTFTRFFIIPWVDWSPDGSLIALTRGSNRWLQDEAFISIFDGSGNLLGKYTFPSLEAPQLWPIGWDAESRFYFSKEIARNRHTRRTYWRISIDDVTPEALTFMPDDECTLLGIVPNGRWVLRRTDRNRDENMVIRLTSITTEEDFLVSESVKSYRLSRDGKFLVFIEAIGDNAHAENQEALPTRLMIYEFSTRRTTPLPLDKPPGKHLRPYWSFASPTDTFWVVTDGEYFIFSPKTREVRKIPPVEKGRWLIHVAEDGRSLWQGRNKLIAAEHDGSDPQEIFRVEDGTFYFYGKEQG